MHLKYPNYVEPGTVVMHDQSKADVTEKFIAVDQAYPGTYRGDRPINLFTVDLRTADYIEIYELAQGGQEPRSIVEFYIIRRKWTPYGYAKVWGNTPTCSPAKPKSAKPYTLHSIEKMIKEAQAQSEKCAAWYKAHRGIRNQPPKDRDYVKMVNTMYRTMRLGGGSAELVELPKTQATLNDLRGDT